MHDRNLTVREAHYSKQEELKYFQMLFPSEVKWLGMMGRRSISWKRRVFVDSDFGFKLLWPHPQISFLSLFALCLKFTIQESLT